MRPTTIALILVILVAIIAAIFVENHRAFAHSGYYRVAESAGNGLNLRTGPAGSYRVIMTMQRGDRLKAFGHKGNWIKVRHLPTGNIGWAWLDYVVKESGTTSGGSGGGLQTCFWNYWGRTVCAPSWIAEAVYVAARHFGASYWWLMAVAACESDFLPSAYGWSGTYGIFQFRPTTFYAWGGGNIWSVYDQAWVAARMFSQGLGYTHWHCYRLIAGG